MSPRLAYAVRIGALAAVYVATARMGLLLDAVSGFAALVWAPAGIALAAALVYGARIWPFVALGAFAVNAWAGAPLPSAAAIAVGNTFEAVVAATALRRLFGFHNSLDRLRDVTALAGLGGVAATAISATVGVVSLALAGRVDSALALETWAAWWWGDLAGVLLVAPILLTWRTPRRGLAGARRTHPAEAALLAGSIFTVGGVVFYGWLPSWAHPFVWPYLVMPLLLWAAIRLGPRGAATANFCTTVLAIVATAEGKGPFAGAVLHQGLLPLQVFLSTSALATLSVAAIVVERAREAASARAADLFKAAILEAAPEAIVTVDRDGVVREFNGSAAELLQVARSEAVGVDLAALLAPASERDRLRRALTVHLETGGGRELRRRWSLPLVRADQTEFPAEITVMPVPIEAGPYFTCVIRDLSAQRAAERVLEQSRDELERRVEERTAQLRELNLDLMHREEEMTRAQRLAHVGSFIWDLGRGALSCSDEIFRIFGVAPRSPIRHQDFLDRIVADDRAPLQRTLATHLADPRPFRFEARIARPDGAIRILIVEAEFEVSSSGQPARLIGACQDVTERWQVERICARLGAIVESSTDAIVGMTMAGMIDSWNRGAERTYGYSAPEVLNRSMMLLSPAERHHEAQRMFDRARNGERVASYETIRRRKDGSLFDASVTLSPICDPASHIIGVSEIVRDITEQKRAESAMKHSLAEKEALLKEIHHRVKNNLQVVASLLGLQTSSVPDDELRRGLEESTLRIQAMALVHQLLYNSRDLASIEFSAYLGDLVQQIGESFGAHERGIRFAVSAPGIHVDIDTAVPCGLIVNELVSNSLKHAFPGRRDGHVAVSLRTNERGHFVLTVADDGIGIPEGRTEGAATLGLQIVPALVKQIRGEIEFIRRGGTTVQIVFPHRAARRSSEVAVGAAASASLPGRLAAAQPMGQGEA